MSHELTAYKPPQGTALVTGVSSGIGAAIAIELAASGLSIAGTYAHNLAGATEVAGKIRTLGQQVNLFACDVHADNQPNRSIEEAIHALDHVDVLVNNVGGPLRRGRFIEGDELLWDELYSLNLRQVFSVTDIVLRKSMLPQGSGVIVNISSIVSRTGGAGTGVVYASFKSAINTFTRGLARELGGTGVRVNAVSPGATDTSPNPPGHAEQWAEMIPLGRIGEPAEIARAVAFLASERSSFITGETLFVAGGY